MHHSRLQPRQAATTVLTAPCRPAGPVSARAKEGGPAAPQQAWATSGYFRHVPTVPVGPKMDGRARALPKPLAQVKAEQDWELGRREADAAYSRSFQAGQVLPP